MTLDEFRAQVKTILRNKIDDKNYIDSLDADIKRAYDEAGELCDLLGYFNPSPDGYALGILMLYPELP